MLTVLLVFDATSSLATLHFHCKIQGLPTFFIVAKHRFALDFTLLFQLTSDQQMSKNLEKVIQEVIKKYANKVIDFE